MNVPAKSAGPGAPDRETPLSVVEALSLGVTMGDLKGVKKSDCEAVYAIAHSFYSQARYRDAYPLFGWLLYMKPYERRFLMACAACEQMLKKFDMAASHYLKASLLDLQDAKPLFHMAECLIAAGRYEDAREPLDSLIEDYPGAANARYRQRARALKALAHHVKAHDQEGRP